MTADHIMLHISPTSSRTSGLRPARTMLPPSSANLMEMALPMPLPGPVAAIQQQIGECV